MVDEKKPNSKDGENTAGDTPAQNDVEKRPLFDEEAPGDIVDNVAEKAESSESVDIPNESADKEKTSSEEVAPDEKTGEETGDDGNDLEPEEIETPRRKGFLKWVMIGAIGFVVLFAGSFFVASRYIHQKEKDLNGRRVKISRKPVVTRQKKVVIKQYDMKPFFIRLPALKGESDRFLSVRLTMEFVRKDLPRELETRKKLLRTLIYKQLKRDFGKGASNRASEEKFRKHIIPALNTFFKGGGVYAVGFKELEER